jgi:hypothetical protein
MAARKAVEKAHEMVESKDVQKDMLSVVPMVEKKDLVMVVMWADTKVVMKVLLLAGLLAL